MTKLFGLQDFIFEKNPTRMELVDYQSKYKATYCVTIYRNHAFEMVEKTIKPFLDFSNLGIEFIYSDYDDSLSFYSLDMASDLIVLWLDTTRYQNIDIKLFIKSRIQDLNKRYKKHILFIPFGDEFDIEGVITYSLQPIKEKLANHYIDLRMEAFSGTKLSTKACVEISRDLGLNYLPVLLKPTLKGIVVDLDNTLYKGVLGEDGVEGVLLTDEHKELQDYLKKLVKKGFFLCIASKNNKDDLKDLFYRRKDFPLQISDFNVIQAHWDSKANSILAITHILNIHVSSLLFIDDNLGELVNVMNIYPEIHTIWAKEDASITLNVLSNYPGLLKLELNQEDYLRSLDIRANQIRQEMSNSLTHEEFIRGLGVELTLDINPREKISRIAELANKTNQFIFSYQRYTANMIQDLMQEKNHLILSISMRDNLSDSGVIGVIVIHKDQDIAILDECFISCRALGRGLDDIIILGAIQKSLELLDLQKLKVNFISGERNLPAKKFVTQHLDKYQNDPNLFHFDIPFELVKVTIKGDTSER